MRNVLSLTAAAALALSIAACEQPASTPEAPAGPMPEAPPSDTPVLTANGYGPLRIGMTLAEVTAAMGPDAQPDAVGGADPQSCDQFRPQQAPDGLLVMMQDGVLTRITISDPSTLKTDRGFGIGSTADEIKTAYGAAAVASPHKYVDAPAGYIDAWTGGAPTVDYVEDAAARGIRYEIDGSGKVNHVHVGGPSIQLVEGCS